MSTGPTGPTGRTEADDWTKDKLRAAYDEERHKNWNLREDLSLRTAQLAAAKHDVRELRSRIDDHRSIAALVAAATSLGASLVVPGAPNGTLSWIAWFVAAFILFAWVPRTRKRSDP